MVGFLAALALSLRVFALDAKSLWLDEFTSLQVANSSLQDLFGGKGFDWHTPPLYYLLLHFWLLVAPSSEFGLRLFSALVDSANAVLVTVLGKRLLLPRVGLWAGIFYTFSPFSVYFAQEARMYPLLIFFVIMLMLSATAALKGQLTSRGILGLVTTGACGMYTHYYFAFVFLFVTLALFSALYRSPPTFRRETIRRWIIGCLGVLLLFLPWVSIVVGLIESGGQSFRKFSFSVLPYTCFRFVAGYANMPLHVGIKEDLLKTLMAHLPLVISYGVVFGAALLLGLRELSVRFPRESRIVLLPLFGVPLLALLISLRIPLLSERYLSAVFPLFSLVLGSALATRGHVLRALSALFVLFGLGRHYFSPNAGFEQWRDAAEKIHYSAKAHLVVVNPEYSVGVLGYYLRSPPYVLLGIRPNPTELAVFLSEFYRRESLLSEGFWLVERGGSPPLREQFIALGFQPTDEELFPFENGISVVHFILKKREELTRDEFVLNRRERGQGEQSIFSRAHSFSPPVLLGAMCCEESVS